MLVCAIFRGDAYYTSRDECFIIQSSEKVTGIWYGYLDPAACVCAAACARKNGLIQTNRYQDCSTLQQINFLAFRVFMEVYLLSSSKAST